MGPAQRGVLLHLSIEENKVMLKTETQLAWGGGCPNSDLLIDRTLCLGAPLRRRENLNLHSSEVSCRVYSGGQRRVNKEQGENQRIGQLWPFAQTATGYGRGCDPISHGIDGRSHDNDDDDKR